MFPTCNGEDINLTKSFPQDPVMSAIAIAHRNDDNHSLASLVLQHSAAPVKSCELKAHHNKYMY